MREVISGVIEEISQGRKHMNLQVFEEAIEYINENFDKDITLEDVSGHVHISPTILAMSLKNLRV